MIEEALQHCDAVVSGEGEALWPQILEDVQSDDLKPVYQGGHSQDLNELPVPRWDLLKLERYFKPIPTLKMPIMSIQTSRGCPHKCDFCTVPVFAGGKMRYRDPAHLLREIDAYGAEFFSIADDNLIVNPDAAAQLFKTLAKRKLSWFGFFDTQTLKRPELVELAARSGCRRAFLGIESIHPNELATVNKKFNRPEKYEDLIRLFHRNGIAVDVGILFGFEDETVESTLETIEELKRCNVETAIFFRDDTLSGNGALPAHEGQTAAHRLGPLHGRGSRLGARRDRRRTDPPAVAACLRAVLFRAFDLQAGAVAALPCPAQAPGNHFQPSFPQHHQAPVPGAAPAGFPAQRPPGPSGLRLTPPAAATACSQPVRIHQDMDGLSSAGRHSVWTVWVLAESPADAPADAQARKRNSAFHLPWALRISSMASRTAPRPPVRVVM